MSQLLIRSLVLSGTVLAVFAGCGHRAEAPAAAPAPAVGTADTAPAAPLSKPPANPQAVALVAGDASATLADLTQALRRFSMERRQVPKTLDEIVIAGYVKNLPAAPTGKKFAINAKQVEVILVNQ